MEFKMIPHDQITDGWYLARTYGFLTICRVSLGWAYEADNGIPYLITELTYIKKLDLEEMAKGV